jgi:nitrite reductase/ring-hydroxylating ferredoxin subunit
MALSSAGLGVSLGAAYLGGHLSFVRGVGVNRTAFDAIVMDWTEVVTVSELIPEKPVRVSAGGVPVVVVLQAGTVHALSATCNHAGGPLDEGQIVDRCIRCPWHSSKFALADGRVVRGPAASDQPAWEVRVDDGRVSVRSWASRRLG